MSKISDDVIMMQLIDIINHDLLGAIIIKKNQQRFPYRTIRKRNYAKYDKDHFLADLKAVPWGTVTQHADTNRAWETLKRLLNKLLTSMHR